MLSLHAQMICILSVSVCLEDSKMERILSLQTLIQSKCSTALVQYIVVQDLLFHYSIKLSCTELHPPSAP